MTKSLFGGGGKQTSTTYSGYEALPGFAQIGFKNIGQKTQDVLDNPSQYFSPMGLTPEELQAQQLIQPLSSQDIAQGVSDYMNPYRDIVFQDINRAFEQGPLANYQQSANEAGAFGGTRYQGGLYDLGRAQADALRSASQSMYDTSLSNFLNQRQAGIGNLLGFGNLQRNIDLSQRQALPSALQFGTGIYSPLLSSQTSTQTSKSGGGLSGALGTIGGLATGIGGVGANMGWWGGYDPFTGITWNSGRVA